MSSEFKVSIDDNDVVVRADFDTWKAIEMHIGRSMIDIARNVVSMTLHEKYIIIEKISKLDKKIIESFLINNFTKSSEIIAEILNKMLDIDSD